MSRFAARGLSPLSQMGTSAQWWMVAPSMLAAMVF